jgi:hypothetical protein
MTTFRAIPLPSRVLAKNERGNLSYLRLHELNPDELAQLCDEFRKRMFKRAGRIDPELIEKRRELLG